MKNLKYRLGLDVGSNSIGWFMVILNDANEPIELGPGGVRIFPDGRDPQTQASNAAERRVARGARRRRDRYLQRRGDLISALVALGLMPEDKAAQKQLENLTQSNPDDPKPKVVSPYALRARAVSEELPLHHLGRALFHLNQRRGFKSNRKSDGANDEKGAIKEASARLREAMKNASLDDEGQKGPTTLGVFLNRMHQKGEGVRVRNTSTGNKAIYDFYPTRDLLEEEFDAIWKKQAEYHPCLTQAMYDKLHKIIFFQRPLKSPPVGKCALAPAKNPDDVDGFRLAKAHPLTQRFRIWQEVRNLAVGETGTTPRPLTKEEGDVIALALFQSNTVTFNKMRTLLKLPQNAHFNLESERRKELIGDETAKRLAAKKLFGKAWRSFSLDRQVEIVDRLLTEQNEEALIDWLVFETGIEKALAEQVADTPLPEGYGRVGRRAIIAMLPHMEEGLGYSEAAKKERYDHAKAPTGEILDYLPYYGECLEDQVVGSRDPHDKKEAQWGRFPNPTVHIGLGQIRRVVNALIRKYGAPEQIVVELARDLKNSKKRKDEIEKEQKVNQRKNEARRQKITDLGHRTTHENLLRMRLWEELCGEDGAGRQCPYTGEVISIQKLFSSEIEIDHIIPYQACWDDSAANKTVCMLVANRAKGMKTPHGAFARSPTLNGRRYDWNDVSARAGGLPKNKRWRFEPNALERFKETGGFQARQLMETSWLARLTREYLSSITNPNEVSVTPGRLTAMLRAKWGLNSLLPDHNFTNAKNRADHRHHAIDALVICLTDRGLLQRMSSAYDEERQKITVPEPWDGFREQVGKSLSAIIVSYKPEHGREGKMHKESAYGINKNQQEGEGNLVYRKALINLTEAEIGRIRDLEIREAVQEWVEQAKKEGTKLPDALAKFGERTDLPFAPHGIRHVRLTKKEKPEYLVPIKDKEGVVYKAYSAGENLFVELFETPDGKWHGEAVTFFQANQADHTPAWKTQFPEAKFVMRVYKGDLLRLETEVGEEIFKVHRLDAASKRFKLARDNEAGSLGIRHDNPDDPFRWLMSGYNSLCQAKAEKVRVDELGVPWRYT